MIISDEVCYFSEIVNADLRDKFGEITDFVRGNRGFRNTLKERNLGYVLDKQMEAKSWCP